MGHIARKNYYKGMSDAELRKEIQEYESWDITDKEWKREGRSHWEKKAEEYGIDAPGFTGIRRSEIEHEKKKERPKTRLV
jgi:hypothetical protein